MLIIGASMMLVLVLLLIVLSVVLLQRRQEDKVSDELPRDIPSVVSTDPRIDRSKVRSKPLELDFKQDLDEKSEGDSLNLELFDGETLDCKIDEIIQEAPDIKSITCSSSKFSAYFVFDGETTLGVIDDYDKYDGNYVVVTDSETGVMTLEEYDKTL